MEPAQLAQVEALCETLYTGVPTSGENGEQIDRTEAQKRLMSLQQSADFIPQCQYILEKTQSQYARLVATNTLTELITTHWNSFTVPQRIDIRNYVLTYLANNGPQLENFVVVSLIKLVCRITKLGWFDDPIHRELADDVTKFLQATVDHCILGLKILNQLVDELNIPTSGRTLTQHRKTSVSFRDTCLLKVFQLGMTTLKQLQTRAITAEPQQEKVLGENSLALIVRCLSFDSLARIQMNRPRTLAPSKHPPHGELYCKIQQQQSYFLNSTPKRNRRDLVKQWKPLYCLHRFGDRYFQRIKTGQHF